MSGKRTEIWAIVGLAVVLVIATVAAAILVQRSRSRPDAPTVRPSSARAGGETLTSVESIDTLASSSPVRVELPGLRLRADEPLTITTVGSRIVRVTAAGYSLDLLPPALIDTESDAATPPVLSAARLPHVDLLPTEYLNGWRSPEESTLRRVLVVNGLSNHPVDVLATWTATPLSSDEQREDPALAACIEIFARAKLTTGAARNAVVVVRCSRGTTIASYDAKSPSSMELRTYSDTGTVCVRSRLSLGSFSGDARELLTRVTAGIEVDSTVAPPSAADWARAIADPAGPVR
jgi:hypothetical protein